MREHTVHDRIHRYSRVALLADHPSMIQFESVRRGDANRQGCAFIGHVRHLLNLLNEYGAINVSNSTNAYGRLGHS
jgi:hypothetical protein